MVTNKKSASEQGKASREKGKRGERERFVNSASLKDMTTYIVPHSFEGILGRQEMLKAFPVSMSRSRMWKNSM